MACENHVQVLRHSDEMLCEHGVFDTVEHTECRGLCVRAHLVLTEAHDGPSVYIFSTALIIECSRSLQLRQQPGKIVFVNEVLQLSPFGRILLNFDAGAHLVDHVVGAVRLDIVTLSYDRPVLLMTLPYVRIMLVGLVDNKQIEQDQLVFLNGVQTPDVCIIDRAHELHLKVNGVHVRRLPFEYLLASARVVRTRVHSVNKSVILVQQTRLFDERKNLRRLPHFKYVFREDFEEGTLSHLIPLSLFGQLCLCHEHAI